MSRQKGGMTAPNIEISFDAQIHQYMKKQVAKQLVTGAQRTLDNIRDCLKTTPSCGRLSNNSRPYLNMLYSSIADTANTKSTSLGNIRSFGASSCFGKVQKPDFKERRAENMRKGIARIRRRYI